MADDDQKPAEPHAMAAYCQPECDWTAVSHHLCDAGISIPSCMICGRINGADIRQQIDEIVAKRTADLRAALARAEETAAQARRNAAAEIARRIEELEDLDYESSQEVVHRYAAVEIAREVGALAADAPAASEPACGSCGGDYWVDDENWQPERWELQRGRIPGSGRIPCGICNHGGWNVPDGKAPSPSGAVGGPDSAGQGEHRG